VSERSVEPDETSAPAARSDDSKRTATETGAVWPTASLALGLATIGSLVVAVPASLRVAKDASLVMAWLALLGSTALVAAPLGAALRITRPFPRLAWCVPLGLSLAFAPLVLFARILILRTHHRPLGGATFAIVAAALLLGAIAVSARVLSWSGARTGPARSLPLGLAGLSLAAGGLLSLPALAAPLRGSLLDGVLLVALVLGTAAVRLPEKLERGLMRSGLVVWVLVVVLGLVVGLASADLRALLDERAPVLLGLAGWLRG